jgi:broad specificity phosphatase PhoE
MRLILARHGNTFDPGDKVVWIGARSDPPLVAKGIQQARAIGRGLAESNLRPDVILAGPLRRTVETARLIADTIGYPVDAIRVDERLGEIDYGVWEGKSSDEICAEFGEDGLAAWQDRNEWPVAAGWQPSLAEMNVQIKRLFADVTEYSDDDIVLFVTSAILLRLIGGILKLSSPRMTTGRVAIVEIKNGHWNVFAWDMDPRSIERSESGFRLPALEPYLHKKSRHSS